jgi:hypothetical protein
MSEMKLISKQPGSHDHYTLIKQGNNDKNVYSQWVFATTF